MSIGVAETLNFINRDSEDLGFYLLSFYICLHTSVRIVLYVTPLGSVYLSFCVRPWGAFTNNHDLYDTCVGASTRVYQPTLKVLPWSLVNIQVTVSFLLLLSRFFCSHSDIKKI